MAEPIYLGRLRPQRASDAKGKDMNKRIIAVVIAGGLVTTAVVAGPATAAKKKKKPAKPAACAPYVPGETGAEATSVVVTDAHTAEAPLVHAFSLDMSFHEGVGDIVNEEAGTSLPPTPHQYLNVQVDSASPTAGLYVSWEFDTNRDYDLYAYRADGTEAASSHGFQPLMATKGQPGQADQSNTAGNHAGESTETSENIVGLITPDCDGYTLDMATYFGEGGDFELKVWLGEGTTAPKEVAPAS